MTEFHQQKFLLYVNIVEANCNQNIVGIDFSLGLLT